MGRYKSINVEVDVPLHEIFDQCDDDDLIEELKRRNCDTRFLDYEMPSMDDNAYREWIADFVYGLNTHRVAWLLEAIHASYHDKFLQEAS